MKLNSHPGGASLGLIGKEGTMPYYGRNDPQEQYQGSGFNPLTGRLQGGQLVMEFINRLQQLKERKKQEQWQLEDRGRQQIFQDLQRKKYEIDIEDSIRTAKERKTPEQELKEKQDWEQFITDQNIRQEQARIEAQAKADEARERIRAGKEAADKERLDKVDAIKERRRETKEKQTSYKKLVSDIAAYEKFVNQLKVNQTKSKTQEEYNAIGQQIFEVQASMAALDSQRQQIAEQYVGKEEPSPAQRRVPQTLPQRKGGESKRLLGIGQKTAPYVPEKSGVTRTPQTGDRRRVRKADGSETWQEYNGKDWVDVKG